MYGEDEKRRRELKTLASYIVPKICPTYDEKKHLCLAKEDKKCPPDECTPHGDAYLGCPIFSKWFWWNRIRMKRERK